MLATQSFFVKPPLALKASGGTETEYSSYYSHRFTADGTLTVNIAATMDIFMVAGGGGGSVFWGSYKWGIDAVIDSCDSTIYSNTSTS